MRRNNVRWIKKSYIKCLGIAALIEIAVLFFTLYPMMEGFMMHSAAARAQRPIINEFLDLFGIVFHFPSIALAFWFPPLIPLVQIFLVSKLLYFISGTSEKNQVEISLK